VRDDKVTIDYLQGKTDQLAQLHIVLTASRFGQRCVFRHKIDKRKSKVGP